MLFSFSFRENFNKIISCHQGHDELSCLHGIRVISCLWIIFFHCHSFLDLFSGAVGNPAEKLSMTQHWWMIPAYIPMAVDSFFLLSGCLAAYTFLRKRRVLRCRTWKIVVWHCVHRFCRLTPMLAVVVFLYGWVSPYIMTGRSSLVVIFDRGTCHNYWWFTVFHVMNFVNLSKMCMCWTWSLSNDFQFHCLALLALLPWASGRKNIGVILCVIGVILSSAIVILLNERDVTLFQMGQYTTAMGYLSKVYFPPWNRIGPFAIGLLLGWVLYRHSTTPCNMTKRSVFVGWGLSIMMGVTSLFIAHFNIRLLHATGEYAWSDRVASVYEALARNVWACAIAWIVYACSTGKGGFVNTFLSWRMWLPLSRLSYGVYLVHPAIFNVILQNLAQPIHIDLQMLLLLSVTLILLSFPMSLVLSLLVECPAQDILSPLLDKLSGAKTDDLSRKKEN